jgi:hypothetical protein
MQTGYALCSSDLQHILCLTEDQSMVELIEIESTRDINRSICVSDLTEARNIADRLQNAGLIRELEIANVARLYKRFY